jgi:phosphomethylpyrimidine synthase
MKITQDVRKFAAEQGFAEADAVSAGLAAKAAEFRAAGDRVYLPIAD